MLALLLTVVGDRGLVRLLVKEILFPSLVINRPLIYLFVCHKQNAVRVCLLMQGDMSSVKKKKISKMKGKMKMNE